MGMAATMKAAAQPCAVSPWAILKKVAAPTSQTALRTTPMAIQRDTCPSLDHAVDAEQHAFRNGQQRGFRGQDF